jgi:hypothetical protein
MNQDAIVKKLESFFEYEIVQARDNLIVSSGKKNVYEIFDRFELHQKPNSAEIHRRGDLLHKFSTARVALSWCIAEKYNLYSLSRDIESLDAQKTRLTQDLHVTAEMLNRVKNSERRETLKLKHDHKRAILTRASNRLDKCTNLAKYWQIRGFNNEIERTGRSAPNRPNRPSDRKPSRSQD